MQKRLHCSADPKLKKWWENYVKNGAPFIGIKMAIIRSTLHKWYNECIADTVEPAGQIDIALSLIREKYSEEKLAGILFIQEILFPADPINWRKDIDRFGDLFSYGYIYDWHICDWFCIKVLSVLMKTHGKTCATKIAKWHNVDNLWQARASLVAFVKATDNTNYYPMILRNCKTLIHREERFAKTAVGWILLEISRSDTLFVNQVITDNLRYFSTESIRNATKHFLKKDRNRIIASFKSLSGKN